MIIQLVRAMAWNSKRLTKLLVEHGLTKTEAREITSGIRKQVWYSLSEWDDIKKLFVEYADDAGLSEELLERFCDLL